VGGRVGNHCAMKVKTKSIRIPENLHAAIKLAACMRGEKLEALTVALLNSALKVLKIKVRGE